MNSTPTDNRLCNISWEPMAMNVRRKVTRSDGEGRRVAGLPRGEGRHATKLTADEVRDIRARAAVGKRGINTRLSEEYGVSRKVIGQIVRRAAVEVVRLRPTVGVAHALSVAAS